MKKLPFHILLVVSQYPKELYPVYIRGKKGSVKPWRTVMSYDEKHHKSFVVRTSEK